MNFNRFSEHRARVWISALIVLAGCAGLALSGCAHRVVNQPATAYDKAAGYRFGNTPPGPGNSDEIFVILAFSGGGTRAAAFSYGAMESLKDTKFTYLGQEHRLLDEVDIISSVSGGSFTAAYYGLFRDRLFTDYPKQFLNQNITKGLALHLLNPVTLGRLTSPYYDRIDMASEYYDEQVFDHKTFRDLAAVHSRPFIVLNATDMTSASRFEFSQDQFDLLSSDLSSYPVARGVTASSAFPILLSPMTLTNYSHLPGYAPPGWIEDALADRQVAPREFAYAQISKSYLDATNRPFIHLLDGGLSDNIGLRGPAYALNSAQGLWSLLGLFNTKIKYLVVITVNAKTTGQQEWDRKESGPGVFSVLSTVTNGPMGNYSDETVQYVRDLIETRRQDIENSRTIAQLRGDKIPPLNEIKFYGVELTFQDVKDEQERAYLNALPTDFSLPAGGVDHLRAAAAQLLHESPEIQRLLEDLKKAPAGS